MESIIEAIRSAFAGTPRGAITIHEAEVIDEYGSAEERREARMRDTEEDWGEVPDDDIEECTAALCHLDREGWRYYIPAYMIWSLRNFRTSDSVVSDFTIYTFDLTHENRLLRNYQLERFSLLSQEQARAVCRFLRFMVSHDGDADGEVAQLALDKYWGRFCNSSDEFADRPPSSPTELGGSS